MFSSSSLLCDNGVLNITFGRISSLIEATSNHRNRDGTALLVAHLPNFDELTQTLHSHTPEARPHNPTTTNSASIKTEERMIMHNRLYSHILFVASATIAQSMCVLGGVALTRRPHHASTKELHNDHHQSAKLKNIQQQVFADGHPLNY